MKIALNREAASRCIHGNRRPVTDALIRCVSVAMGDTGQSRIVALGILSAYNGHRFKFDISLLGALDEQLCRDLFQVWYLRHQGHEPHQFIRNGGEVFESIARDWDFEHGCQETDPV